MPLSLYSVECGRVCFCELASSTTVGVGDDADTPLEDSDNHETVDENVTVNGDEVEKLIAVGIDGVESTVVQDYGIETGLV